MQQHYTHRRLVEYPYFLVMPSHLYQNNYQQNMNLVIKCGEAHNHHPSKWTKHDNNPPLIYLTLNVYYLLSDVVCNILFLDL